MASADDMTIRIQLATFAGMAWINPARGSTPAYVTGYAGRDECQVAGVRGAGGVPFLLACEFYFRTDGAPASRKCTGTWIHTSRLTFYDPVSGHWIDIVYDPTTTAVVEGDGSGVGFNSLRLSKVHYDITSLCALASEQDDEVEANLVGYATGPY